MVIGLTEALPRSGFVSQKPSPSQMKEFISDIQQGNRNYNKDPKKHEQYFEKQKDKELKR